MRVADIMGQRFGRLVVIARGPIRRRTMYWQCLCDCGNERTVRGSALRAGDIRSCGCLQRDVTVARQTTHGLSRTSEYEVWAQMKDRCTNPNNKQYKDYGGRGISVCERWMESFSAFYIDMGLRPGAWYQLHRLNHDGNYEPSNCAWVLPYEHYL